MRPTLCFWLALFLVALPLSSDAADDDHWQAMRSPELGKLLRELNNRYGADTVALLSQLNDASIHHGESVLTATVSVEGKESSNNATFLSFRVETGIIFNTLTVKQEERLASLWDNLLVRAFSHFDTITIPTDGIVVKLLSHCKAMAAGELVADHVDEPGPIEDVKFYFLGDPLRAYLGKQLPAAELLQRSSILVNDVPIRWTVPQGATQTKSGQSLSPNEISFRP